MNSVTFTCQWNDYIHPGERRWPHHKQRACRIHKGFTYCLRTAQGREVVSMSYRTHLGCWRTSWERSKAGRRSGCRIAPTWGVHVQAVSRPRPRDGQHVPSHPLEVFTYFLRVDQGREPVSMSYRTHLSYSRTLCGARPPDGQHVLSHPLEVFTYSLGANQNRKTVSMSYSTHCRSPRTNWVQNNASSASLSHHLRCSRTSWSDQHQRRSVCAIVHIQGVHILSEHRAVPCSQYGVSHSPNNVHVQTRIITLPNDQHWYSGSYQKTYFDDDDHVPGRAES
jgi:hypothetical protein